MDVESMKHNMHLLVWIDPNLERKKLISDAMGTPCIAVHLLTFNLFYNVEDVSPLIQVASSALTTWMIGEMS